MLLNYSFIPLLLHHFVTTVLVAVEVCLRTSAGLGNIESSLFLPLCVFPIDKTAICLFALTAGMLFYHSHRWRYDLYLCAAKVIETLPFFCHIDWTAKCVYQLRAALKMLSCHIHKDRFNTPCHLISNVTYL